MEPTEAPIACTLGAAALVDREGAWQRVMATGLRSRAATGEGVVLTFDAAVERAVRELVALEADCCAWFTGTVTPAAEAVVVTFRAAGDGRDVLRAMFDVAAH